MLFGPGDIKVAHSEEEFITKASMDEGVRLYKEVVSMLLGR